jgi:hypothetical protein
MPDTTPHEPTEATRAQVVALCTYGIAQESIAAYIGIDAKTLRKYYRVELDEGATEAHSKVGKFLFHNATGMTLQDGATHADCVRAAMFWAKTRMGWRESSNLDVTSNGESITRIERVIIDSPSDQDA